MGMSASQARLLSITTRLTNNEFRSQMTANSKIKLANQTQAASNKYMAALDATKMLYSYYDAKGNKSQETLTANVINFYQPLKNQYGLINNAGQIMVNHNDSSTFQQANNLNEFLELNDCLTFREWQEPNPKWDIWKNREPKETDEIYWDTVITQTSDLYEKFVSGTASGCWSSVMAGNAALFHLGDVLSHLLDLGSYTTTDGDSFTIADGPSVPFYHWWDGVGGGSNGVNGDPVIMAEIRAELEGRNCCGKHEDEYHQDCNPNESFTQKVVDLLWDSQHPEPGEEESILNRAKHLVFYDLKYALSETKNFNEELYNNDHNKWLADEPDKILNMREDEIIDPDKAEWYTNLWYRMNGALFDEEQLDVESSTDYNVFKEKYYEKTTDSKQSWVELDDNMLNSSEWLQYVLETGTVTLEQVKFQNPTETSTELEYHEWTAVAWSSTSDILEVEDSIAITKAEVEYNKTLAMIQSEDKKLENDIKKLDTEHNALQTEYDSIKGVMDKNMERSFKAFS